MAYAKKLTTDPTTLRFAQAIREARKRMGLTQEELAMNAGLPNASYVQYIEAGYGTTLQTAAAIAVALNLNMNKIIRGSY